MKSIKFTLDNGVTRRVGTAEEVISVMGLYELVNVLFPEIYFGLSLSWIDDEGDKIAVSSDAEVSEAFSVMSKQDKGHIKFNVSKSTGTKERSPLNCVQCNSLCSYPYFQSPSYPQLILCNSCELKISPFYVPMLKLYKSNQPTRTTHDTSPRKISTCEPLTESTPAVEHTMADMSRSCDSLISSLTANSTASSVPKPKAKFVMHLSYPDSTQVPAGSVFLKAWRIRNDGVDVWPPGCALVNAGGDMLFPSSMSSLRIAVPCVAPSECTDISVELTAPIAMGRYQGYFRMQTQEGKWFGQRLWADIRVPGIEGVSPSVDVAGCVEGTVGEDEELITPTLPDIAGGDGEGADEEAELAAWENSCVALPPGMQTSQASAGLATGASAPTSCPPEWQRELDVLGGMGFVDTQRNISLLERHSAEQSVDSGSCTSQIALQLTVGSLLGV